MTFLQLYGEELTLQLASDDATNRFTTARRKAQVNNGQREFVRLTECVKRNGALPLVDEQATYDLEAAFTDFWWLSEREGISIAIDDGTTVRYLVEGKDLERVDKRRLDREHPGWRSADPGTPRFFCLDRDGGALNLCFFPPPDIAVGETWTATVPYVPSVPDMVGASDIPFTFAGNPLKSLEAWHLACTHYAAYKMETARKRYNEAKDQLQFFAALVKDFLDKQKVPGGDQVAYAHDYMATLNQRRAGAFSGDVLTDW